MIERLLYLIEKYPLNFISHLCSSLPLFLGLILFKNLSIGFRILLLFFALYFISDSLSLWLAVIRTSTFPIQNLLPLFEIWLIAIVYLYNFQTAIMKKYIKYGSILCSTIIIFSFREDNISTIGLTTQHLFVTVVVLLYFNKILVDVQVKYVFLHGMFWVSAGLLIYSAGTFFFSLFSSYLYSNTITNEEFDPIWKLNQILYIIFCLMSFVGIWVSKYDQKNLV